jgi:hypothetical protein
VLAAIACFLAACSGGLQAHGQWSVRYGACQGTITLQQRGRTLTGSANLCGYLAEVRGLVNSNEALLYLHPPDGGEVSRLRLVVVGRYASGQLNEDDGVEAWLGGEPDQVPVNKPRESDEDRDAA